MMANKTRTVSYEVQLAIEGATKQIARLKQLLNDSVRPESSSYKTLLNMLSAAQRQAERLQMTASTSLESSKGSKKLSADLFKLGDSIDIIVTRMHQIASGDIIASPEELARIEEMSNSMVKIRQQMDAIQNLSVGDMFDEGTAEMQQMQEVAKLLGRDLDTINADKMQGAIGHALDKINSDIDRTAARIDALQKVLDKTTGINGPTALAEIQATGNKFATTVATKDQQERQQTVNEINRIRGNFRKNAVASGFINPRDANKDITIKESDLNNKSRAKILDEQMTSINQIVAQQTTELRTRVDEYTSILDKLNAAYRDVHGQREGLRNLGASDPQFTQVLNQLGYEGTLEEILAAQPRISSFYPILREQLQQAVQRDNQALEQMNQQLARVRQDLQKAINENLSEIQIVDKDNLKVFVKNVRQKIDEEFGVDNPLSNSLKEWVNSYARAGMDVKQFYEDFSAEIEQKKGEIEQQIRSESEALEGLSGKKTLLEGASTTLDKQVESLTKTVEELREQIKKYQEQLDALTEGKKANFQREVDTPSSPNEPTPADTSKRTKDIGNLVGANSDNLANTEKVTSQLGNIKSAITNWMGFYQVLNMTRSAITSMKNHIQELDQVMTQIAVVTSMTQEDLWAQIGTYSEIARQYGVSIKGVYQVSQIFYQQGGSFLEKFLSFSKI